MLGGKRPLAGPGGASSLAGRVVTMVTYSATLVTYPPDC